MNKILSTHVGSLPRKNDLLKFIFARDNEETYNEKEFLNCLGSSCDEIVRRQVESGIDIVCDGEISKISYSTYVKDRYTGFSGDGKWMLNVLRAAVSRSNAREVHAHVSEFDGIKSPLGFAAVVLIDESHVSAHCYAEEGILAVDCFTCGVVDPVGIVEDIHDENYAVDRGDGAVPIDFYIKKWGVPEGFGKTDHEKLWSME